MLFHLFSMLQRFTECLQRFGDVQWVQWTFCCDFNGTKQGTLQSLKYTQEGMARASSVPKFRRQNRGRMGPIYAKHGPQHDSKHSNRALSYACGAVLGCYGICKRLLSALNYNNWIRFSRANVAEMLRKVERTNHSHHKDARKNATVKNPAPLPHIFLRQFCILRDFHRVSSYSWRFFGSDSTLYALELATSCNNFYESRAGQSCNGNADLEDVITFTFVTS